MRAAFPSGTSGSGPGGVGPFALVVAVALAGPLPAGAQVGPSPGAGSGPPARLVVSGSVGVGRIAGDGAVDATAGPGLLLLGGCLVVRGLLDVSLRKAEPDARYRQEAITGGRVVCRDGETGRFADPDLCSPNDLLTGGLAEAGWAVAGGAPGGPGALTAGAGYRFGDAATPYVVVGYVPAPSPGGRRSWSVVVRGGEAFVTASVAVTIG